ncbi:MAG: hypothetical protein AB2669_07175 [Candidatus Thiodiazotropha endolucinida]|nr:hypothetical protein [Candidatus Thiodiazotropha taylori]MCW4225455.1 hypothetical protein [Candidatus Thiodiazotropha endolucinida]MCG7883124.1 hypothetical protein [Candidatus Thiodiazotropha taylori]MCG7887025.1 hypothetical protein [Candidatus Thiodiazotropha taylori]MCG7892602.1 hypothetical protein [Candidatus Thiodiazotropha taylori]
MSFGYLPNEHDVVLLEIVEEAISETGVDGIPSNPELRSAHAVEEYVTHRTLAAVLQGIKARGLNIREAELIGAYVDGIQSTPDRGFP